ncbi:hypothetical protein DUI87_03081 [Hirundo rustica rustica]|uniref:ribonuclease H n=1 Tax=Hirundo rustica rustica TaxID=333673 RepID=A0A3M0L6D4_HIRRU|nr:hypothetical protein DUI87_03081 [Hirundo rustica rustica]
MAQWGVTIDIPDPSQDFWAAAAEERPTRKLNWKTDSPVWVEQWPLSKQKLKALEELVEEQLAKGHIVETISPWNSSVFVIRKPGKDKWRLLQDLRQINNVIEDMGSLQPGLKVSPVICQWYVASLLSPVRVAVEKAIIHHYMDDVLVCASTDDVLSPALDLTINALVVAGFELQEDKVQRCHLGVYVSWMGGGCGTGGRPEDSRHPEEEPQMEWPTQLEWLAERYLDSEYRPPPFQASSCY